MSRTEFSDLGNVIDTTVAPSAPRSSGSPFRAFRHSVDQTDIMLDLPDNILNSSAVNPGLASDSPNGDGLADLRNAAEQIWKMCLETIKAQLSAQTVRTWFEPLTAIALEGSEITLRAPSNFFCEWITEHYQEILEKSIREVLGSTARFKFDSINEIEGLNTKLEAAPQAPIAETSSANSERKGQQSPATNGFGQQNGNAQFGQNQGFNQNQAFGENRAFGQNQNSGQQNGFNQGGMRQPANAVNAFTHQNAFNQGHSPAMGGQRPPSQSTPAFVNGNQPNPQQKRQSFDSNLNPRYTFDTFIRGESNKLAYAAAMAVANNPGGTRYNPLVIYGNVGLGKTHVIQAVGNAVVQKFSGARVLYTSSDRFTVEFVDAVQNDRVNEFQSLYRSIDVLIIDDVQFFAGKEKTQDIFFHSFNALRELGKQIILTCDRPPKELKDIDDRLLNRLQWGLTADIGAPDLETRIAILRHKAISDGIELPSEVIEFIATNVTTNIRELEGCLISLLATASLEGREPTIEVAKDVLRKVAKRSAPILSIESIQRSVAKKFNIEEELLRAKTRKQEVVQARQVAMYLAKELTNSSLKTIGLHFGGRDHSTVIHACQTVSDDMRHNSGLASKVEELRRQFELMQ